MKNYKIVREVVKFNPSVKGLYETTEKGTLKSNMTLIDAKEYLKDIRLRAKKSPRFDGAYQSGCSVQAHRVDDMIFIFKIVKTY